MPQPRLAKPCAKEMTNASGRLQNVWRGMIHHKNGIRTKSSTPVNITGRPPYTGNDPVAVMTQHLRNQHFVVTRAIHVGGVPEVDPQFQRFFEQGEGRDII